MTGTVVCDGVNIGEAAFSYRLSVLGSQWSAPAIIGDGWPVLVTPFLEGQGGDVRRVTESILQFPYTSLACLGVFDAFRRRDVSTSSRSVVTSESHVSTPRKRGLSLNRPWNEFVGGTDSM